LVKKSYLWKINRLIAVLQSIELSQFILFHNYFAYKRNVTWLSRKKRNDYTM